MTHDLQTIETAIKHFCYQNGIDYTGILEVYNGGVWVDSSKINNDQIKMIKGYMKRLQEIGREGVVDPHSLAHIGGGLDRFDNFKAKLTEALVQKGAQKRRRYSRREWKIKKSLDSKTFNAMMAESILGFDIIIKDGKHVPAFSEEWWAIKDQMKKP